MKRNSFLKLCLAAGSFTGKENLIMVFQYSPAGFEEYFIENGTQVGMPAKEKTEEEYSLTEKKYGKVYKDKL